jgi:hypothetical protein
VAAPVASDAPPGRESDSRERRFNVGDALIALGALAISFALLRSQPYRGDEFLISPGPGPAIARAISIWFGFVTPFLATATLAVLAIRLRRPRPPMHGLTCEAGATACLAAALVMAIDLTAILVDLTRGTIFGYDRPRASLLSLVTGKDWSYVFADASGRGHPDPVQVGLAVAATWFVLALGRRLRRPRGWIDRAGWILGLAWVVLILGRWFAR